MARAIQNDLLMKFRFAFKISFEGSTQSIDKLGATSIIMEKDTDTIRIKTGVFKNINLLEAMKIRSPKEKEGILEVSIFNRDASLGLTTTPSSNLNIFNQNLTIAKKFIFKFKGLKFRPFIELNSTSDSYIEQEISLFNCEFQPLELDS